MAQAGGSEWLLGLIQQLPEESSVWCWLVVEIIWELLQMQFIFGFEGIAWGWWKGHPLESEDEALVNMKGKGRETFCHSVLLFAIYIF